MSTMGFVMRFVHIYMLDINLSSFCSELTNKKGTPG